MFWQTNQPIAKIESYFVGLTAANADVYHTAITRTFTHEGMYLQQLTCYVADVKRTVRADQLCAVHENFHVTADHELSAHLL